MTDREKIIKGLECCKIPFTKCFDGGCPYFENDGCKARLKADALALLKEQEPIAPILDERVYKCGACKTVMVGTINCWGNITIMEKYCRECGRAVKWE